MTDEKLNTGQGDQLTIEPSAPPPPARGTNPMFPLRLKRTVTMASPIRSRGKRHRILRPEGAAPGAPPRYVIAAAY